MSFNRFLIRLDQIDHFFRQKMLILRFPFYETGMIEIFSINNFFKKLFKKILASSNELKLFFFLILNHFDHQNFSCVFWTTSIL